MILLLAWMLAWNGIAFALMGIDKWKARRDRWRVPEKALLGSALVGGSLGALIGMRFFRHKTKHRAFRFGLPAILIFHILLVLGWAYYDIFL